MTFKRISSRDNGQIKALVTLMGDSKERRSKRQFVAEGLRTCATLIEHGVELVQLYVLEPMIEKIDELSVDIEAERITLVNTFVMEKISSATTPSGVVGLFKMPIPPAHGELSTGIVLANITDPGNMGTLLRTAAAMGVASVVCVEGVDPWNPKVVQASAGTLGQLTLFQWSWQKLLQHKKQLMLHALVPHGGKPVKEVAARNALLVVGNEAHGLPDEWIAKCDTKVTLAMPGNTESLNAAVAGSIALYLVFGMR